MENYEAIIEYIKELENENKSLKDKIKIVEQDRDEIKRDVVSVFVKLISLSADKYGLNKIELHMYIAGNIKRIVEDIKNNKKNKENENASRYIFK